GPRTTRSWSTPENDPVPCRNSPVGTSTSHNPTLVGELAFITWYSSGLQVFDLADPAHPQRLTEFRPTASEPGQRDPQLGATLPMTWSYPIVRDGLIYVADINQGLYVLRYQGPHADELARVAFAEGNSNLFSLVAEPSPSPAGRAAVASSPPGKALPTVHPAATNRTAASASSLYVVGGAAVGTLILIALISYSR